MSFLYNTKFQITTKTRQYNTCHSLLLVICPYDTTHNIDTASDGYLI